MFKKILLYTTLLLMFSCSHKKLEELSVIELVDTDYRFCTASLLDFAHENNLLKDKLYMWQNHWLIVDDKAKVARLATKIQKKYPHLAVHVYDKPFYFFDRQRYVNEKRNSKCKQVILTTNLVNDPSMQQKFMEYCCIRSGNLPVLTSTFINSRFQQVCVFRNGRQLMLIASVPQDSGVSHPAISQIEGNQVFAKWSNSMRAFEEGLENAPKGSTWVRFDELVQR